MKFDHETYLKIKLENAKSDRELICNKLNHLDREIEVLTEMLEPSPSTGDSK